MKLKIELSYLLMGLFLPLQVLAWQPQQFGDKKELSLVIVYTISKQSAEVKDSDGIRYYLQCTSEPLYDGKKLSGIFVFYDTMDYALKTLPVLMRESEYAKQPSQNDKGTATDNTAGKPSAHVKGRNTVGNIPRPAYNTQENGTVVVTVLVDNYGNVKKAIAGADGTTVTDNALWAAARNAALDTHFNMDADAPAMQEGTITYCFNISGADKKDTDCADNGSLEIEIMEYVEETLEEEAIPFQLVEKKPSFQGGDANDFSKWVNERLIYPEIAKKKDVQGRVMLQFTIGTDGRVSDVKVLSGVEASLDKEAVRVVSSSPKWKPGMSQGSAVPVTYDFPVIFQLR